MNPLKSVSGDEVFKCKTCNRKFTSFQALGGHRASHKRPKLDDVEAHPKSMGLGMKNKPRMHECSICGQRFSLGQALGGHIRKHRDGNNEGFSSINLVDASARVMCFDLNLTPIENDLKLLFGTMTPKCHQISLSSWNFSVKRHILIYAYHIHMASAYDKKFLAHTQKYPQSVQTLTLVDEERERDMEGLESIDLANCLMLLSGAQERKKSFEGVEYECKTCNRRFSSFQALGGHRTSHKRLKLDMDELKAHATCLSLGNKPKMHECSICGQKFSLGQALGGHMRRHRSLVDEEFCSIKIKEVVAQVPLLKRLNSRSLDLNLTPLENHFKLLFGKMEPNNVAAFL
ncbi:hypothetical protein VNO77_17537 [Canavalia gladiata]|uniref:C2H2-type domain-containing protein n=1 Tax=Canavalia gladiata TaxID=3824 RepID=A0AAN9QJG2_CANGL